MNKYSTDVKNAVLRKILGPEGRPVSAVCAEMGLNVRTVYGWIKAAQNGQMGKKSRAPGMIEKFALLMEASGLSEEDLGRWLREKGLHEGQLKLWEQEIESQLGKRVDQPSRELEQENKALKKEIRRKDRALAEMSALVMLKKKVREMFGDEELPL